MNYLYGEHLSPRVVADAAGNKMGEQGHYPFGETWYQSGTTTKWQFTSYERDAESALDYAVFRYDATRLGRFMTPDPLAGSILNPQSLNRYAYVINDPINLVDPLGLSCTLACVTSGGTHTPYTTRCQWFCGGAVDGSEGIFAPRIDGVVGGHGPGPGLKQTLECAAQNADNFDLAFLTGTEGTPLEFFTGSVIGPAIEFLLNPTAGTAQGAAGAGANVALTQTNAASQAVNAVGNMNVDPGFQTLFNTVPATRFGRTPVGSAVTKIGGATAEGLRAIGRVPTLAFDASVFTFSFFLCGS